MNESDARSLDDRIEKLERKVEELQRILTPREASSQASRKGQAPEVRAHTSNTEGGVSVQPASRSAEPTGSLQDSESWLGRIGIGLVLFGVIFLFNYSIDQGWITPPVRVLFGLAVGIGLLVAGARMRVDRRPLGQVMSGGGIGALYISGFAAYRLYELVSHPAAFAFMVSVTLLAFLLSQRQQEPVLSIIGTLGGFGTPFLLYQGSGNLPGLVAYTCLVMGGAAAVYLRRGWYSLFWVSFGAWWLTYVNLSGPRISGADPAALQAGILFGWLASWLLPVYREIRTGRTRAGEAHPGRPSAKAFPHAHLATAISPLLALWLSGIIWSLTREEWGWMALAAGILYSIAAWLLRDRDGTTRLAYTHVLMGLLLGTVSLCLLVKGDALFLGLAAEAAVLHLVSHRLSDPGTRACAHALFAVVAVWLGMHLGMRVMATRAMDAHAMTDLAVILVAAGISRAIPPRDIASFYRILAHLAFLAWLWGALTPLPNGVGYVSITWGIYAVILLILGLRLNLDGLRVIAMGTLFLVVGKLFLMDLASLKAIWRILLFLGFGGLFLGLSYLVRILWKPAKGI